MNEDLTKLEFYIRKGIAVHCIPNYCKMSGKTQRDLGSFLGVTQPVVSKWIKFDKSESDVLASVSDSHNAPALFHILRMSSYFHKSIKEMMLEVVAKENDEATKRLRLTDEIIKQIEELANGIPEEKNANLTLQKGEEHFSIIRKLEKTRYLGFFFADDPNNCVGHFIMETGIAAPSASVPAFIRVIGKAENVYRCNIVSPANQKHLYIYMRQDGGKNDRGLAFFQVDEDMQGIFLCGSGAMLSTNRSNGEKRLQWVIIIKLNENDNPITAEYSGQRNAGSIQKVLQSNADAYNAADAKFEEHLRNIDKIIADILLQPIPTPDGHYLDVSGLKDRQDMMFKNIYPMCIQNVDLSSIWTETHHFVASE